MGNKSTSPSRCKSNNGFACCVGNEHEQQNSSSDTDDPDEGPSESQDQDSTSLKAVSQLTCQDCTDCPRPLVPALKYVDQGFQTKQPTRQVQVNQGFDDRDRKTKTDTLPTLVESDNASTAEDYISRLSLESHIIYTNSKGNCAVPSRLPNVDEDNAAIQGGQTSTQHPRSIEDDDHTNIPFIDDSTEAINELGSFSSDTSLNCSDDSSLDETHEEDSSFEENDQHFQQTGPASSMFSPTWEASGVFGREGGELQKRDSDVKLLIPPGAINSGSKVTVYAAVTADLEHLYDKLEGKLKKKEVIVSPAAEYWVEKDWKFEQPVTIILPHILPTDFTADEVRVYHITRDDKGGVSLTALLNRDSLPPRGVPSKGSTSNSSFGVDKDYVIVQTDHFSAILCTYCSKMRKVKKHPELFMRSSGTFADCGSCQAIDLHVLIWDKRLHIKDFMDESHGVKLDDYGKPVPIGTSSKTHKELRLSIVKSIHHPELRLCLDAEGQPISAGTKIFDLEKKFGCQKCINKQKYSLMRHDWSMELPPESKKIDDIHVHVLAVVVSTERDEDKTTHGFTLHKTRNADVPLTPIEPEDDETYKYVSKAIVLKVARGLGASGSKTFFLDLGLSTNQYDDKNRFHKTLCDINLDLLHVWCQSPEARNRDAVQQLIYCLRKHKRTDLAEKVEKIISSKKPSG